MNKTTNENKSDKKVIRNTALGFVLGMLVGGMIDVFTGDYGLFTVSGMLLGALVGYRSAGRLHLMEYSLRVIRYLLVTGVLFFASLLAFFYLLDGQNGGSLGVIAALIPALFALLFVLALSYAISTLDEMQRRIQVEAIAIGFGITALIALAIGMFGLVGLPQPDWLLLMPIMVGGWVVGKLWTRWRY